MRLKSLKARVSLLSPYRIRNVEIQQRHHRNQPDMSFVLALWLTSWGIGGQPASVKPL